MPDRDQFLFICSDCSVVTFENVDECAACGSQDDFLTLAFEDRTGTTLPDEFEDHDLVEAEAASMTDEEILRQFRRREKDPVWGALAEDIAERFAATLNDD